MVVLFVHSLLYYWAQFWCIIGMRGTCGELQNSFEEGIYNRSIDDVFDFGIIQLMSASIEC